jgi:WD40 repeat protein
MPPFIETSANGLVILGGYGGDVVVWDVKANVERYRLPGAPGDYPYFGLSNAAKLMAIGLPGEEGFVRVRVVDLESGKPVWSFDAETGSHHSRASSVALSRDGRLLGIDVQKWVLIYDVVARKLLTKIPSHPYFPGRNLTFTADGSAIIGGVTHAMLTDIATGKRIRQFGPFSDNFHAADVSPDGKYLVTGHLGSDGRIWEIATGTFHRRLGKDVKPPR